MDGMTAFCESTYLLARFCPPVLNGWLRGQRWQRWVTRTARVPGAHVVQGPGSLTLFGLPAASGLAHELDTVGAYPGWSVMTEAKAYERHGPTKNDVCIFDRKTFDFYITLRRRSVAGPHWRVIASASPMDDRVRRYCYLYGIIAVDSLLVPLPVLLSVAAKPEADQWLPEVLLTEAVRLGELAAGPLESRYMPDGPDHLRFNATALNERDLDDLLWVQKTLSDELLDLVDRERPWYYERRAEALLGRLGIAIAA
ncbi:MAG: hypothetical protein ACREX3_01590 [Gammaproteobacteria bacterium]